MKQTSLEILCYTIWANLNELEDVIANDEDARKTIVAEWRDDFVPIMDRILEAME